MVYQITGNKSIEQVTSHVISMTAMYYEYNMKKAYEQTVSEELKSKYSFDDIHKYYVSRVSRGEYVKE